MLHLITLKGAHARTHAHTHTHKVGILWTRDRPGADFWQHTTLTTDTHAFCGIRTRNPSKRETADPRLRSRSHRDRQFSFYEYSLLLCLTFWAMHL